MGVPFEAALATLRLPDAARTDMIKIREWWRGAQAGVLARYEKRTYPEGWYPSGTGMPPGDDEGRVAWLRLLMLGALHTEGRPSLEARRNFTRDVCDRKDWLGNAARSERDYSACVDNFLEHLDGYEQHIEHARLLRQLPSMLALGRWVDEYARAFLFANHWVRPFSLDLVTEPRVSDLCREANVDAPPASQFLGIGGCFVMRELVRAGFVTNKRVFPYCFVPTRQVRRLLTDLGCLGLSDDDPLNCDAAPVIHKFLVEQVGERDADFDLAFDIPLLEFAGNRDLQKEVLGYVVASSFGAGEA